MKYLVSVFCAALVLGSPLLALASGDDQLHTFRSIYTPDIPELAVPTRVQMRLPDTTYGSIAVINTNGEPQPVETYRTNELDTSLRAAATDAIPLLGDLNALSDNNTRTTAEFEIQDGVNQAVITLESDQLITTSQLQLRLAPHVALPHEVAISAGTADGQRIVVARTRMSDTRIAFPNTTASTWQLTLWYVQPLRIADIILRDEHAYADSERYAVWLAQPGDSYTIYADAAAATHVATGESGRLLGDMQDVVTLERPRATSNISFVEPDKDADNIPNLRDNCVSIANPDQQDADGNGRGDVCEDHDRDGVLNMHDNCPNKPNRAQRDIDNDGIGDICDTEESRITERLPWLPWLAIGGAACVAGFVLFGTVRKK